MATVTIPAAGQYGVLSDAAPQELPPNAWTSALNMRFRDGYAERFGGQVQIFGTPAVTPYFVAPYSAAGARFWVHAGTARAYVDDGATRTDITNAAPYTGGIDDRWTGGTVGGVLVLNNKADQPQFWGGNVANKLAPLTGWNTAWRAASVRPFKQYLVALDVTKTATRYPHMVKWSHAADPGTIPVSWDETDPTKDAGEQDLAETPDLLVDQLPLGDINVVYKERSMYLMQYIGQPYIWRFARLPGDVGMLARGCAVETPAGHVVLCAGDVIVHNGQGPKSILTARMRRWLFNKLDSTYFARSFVVANPKRAEVWICFPTAGSTSCNLALVWNWADDALGVRELRNATCGAVGQINYTAASTWAADAEAWSVDASTWDTDEYSAAEARLLLGEAAPSISMADTGANFNGATVTASLERIGLALDAPDIIKTVRSVVPRIEAPAGTVLSIEVGGAMDAETLPVWSPAVPYIVGTTRKADAFATGRFLSVRITGTGAQAWRMKSYDLDVISRGRF